MIEFLGEQKDAVVRGVRLRYIEAGEGTPLVLVHGLTSSKVAWRENIEVLAERHRVYAVDLPGHGDSEKYGVNFESEFIVGLMRDFVLSLGHERVAMAGISLGGGVSLFTALEHPEMVSKLVLCGSGALGREIAMVIRMASVPLVGELLLGGPLDNVGAMTRKCFYDKSLVPSEVVEELRRTNSLPGAVEAALTIIRRYIGLRGVRSPYVMTERLGELSMPTMLFWGADDEIIPVDHAHRAARLIPGAGLHVFERCGHWPQMERSEEFNELMLGFLAG